MTFAERESNISPIMEIGQALNRWKQNPRDETAIQDTQKALDEAMANGYGLRLTVDAKVMEGSGPNSVGINREDAELFGRVDEDKIVLESPSKEDFSAKNRGSGVKARIYRDEPSLLFNTRSVGTIGIFRPDEIIDIELVDKK